MNEPVRTGSLRRRFVRFLLATACLMILFCAGGAWWWFSRPDFGETVRGAGGHFHYETDIVRYLLGREPSAQYNINFEGDSVDDQWLHSHREDLARLEYFSLWLRETRVTGDGLSALSGMHNLRYLELTGTPLDDADIAHIAAIPGIGQLYVPRTGITGAALAGLSQMLSLGHICIDPSQATPEGIAGLATCQSLNAVTVFDVNDESVEQVCQLNGLIWLDLVGADITAASLPTLKQMEGLQHLMLYDSNLSHDELLGLQQALPGCTVQQMPYSSAPFVQAREELWE